MFDSEGINPLHNLASLISLSLLAKILHYIFATMVGSDIRDPCPLTSGFTMALCRCLDPFPSLTKFCQALTQLNKAYIQHAIARDFGSDLIPQTHLISVAHSHEPRQGLSL